MIFYLHIPKTGGQTLSIRLASAFAPSRVYMMGSDLNFPRDLSIFNEFLRSKDFVGTHVSGSIPPGEHKIKILVTVRNPIQHLVSLYSHIRREPADNLHRAANLLSPQKLLEVFESFFTNFQTRSLVKSLYPLEPIKHMKGIDRWLLDNLYSALDRLHWLIPTDRIDEFTALWSLENGISVPQSTTRVNIAPREDDNLVPLTSLLRSHPQLYALDTILYQEACKWFIGYRNKIISPDQKKSLQNDSTLAYARNDSGIWLVHGWHLPSVKDDGICEWWAGPSIASEVLIVRANSENFLSFEISVVHAIEYEEIKFFHKGDLTEIDVKLEPVGDIVRVTVPLKGFAREDSFIIYVPRVFSSIQTSPTDENFIRRSFRSQNWYLTGE